MNIAVVHNAVAHDAPAEDRDVLVQAAAVSEALTARGHRVATVPVSLDLAALKTRLSALKTEVVFNLVEGLDGTSRLISLVPAALEAWGIPFTGSGAAALWVTTHKTMAKERLRAAGIPTPPWIGPWPAEMPPPGGAAPRRLDADRRRWIVKSLWEHASFGLDDDPLVSGCDAAGVAAALHARAPALGGACFAEAYVDGREFNLALLAGAGGPRVLPPAEILFEGYGPDRLRIVGYRAKWAEESYEYHHPPRRYDFEAQDAALLDSLRRTAIHCWRIFALEGWARVDFRVDERGRPWVLEVNANPCLSPDAGFAAALARAGVDYRDAVQVIVDAARLTIDQ